MESLEKMSLDLTPEALEPLDYLDDVNGVHNHNREQLPIAFSMTSSSSSQQTSSPTPSSLFLTSRRRAQSDDGPAINETRLLELPDKMAEIRERMRSLLGRQTGRLKTLKLVASFNEDVAAAIETFASGLRSRLEVGPSLSGGDRPSSSWGMPKRSRAPGGNGGGIMPRSRPPGGNGGGMLRSRAPGGDAKGTRGGAWENILATDSYEGALGGPKSLRTDWWLLSS